MITKPLLPPKKGFVEVERNGQRVYKNVETGEILAPNEVVNYVYPDADRDAMLVDLEYRLTLLELGITEE